MTFERVASIVFYLLIAAVTCRMAFYVEGVSREHFGRRMNVVPEYVNGQRTRRSFFNRLLLIGIFLILFLCSALRFDIGNDYRQYTQTAHEAYVGGYVVTEAGFNGLVKFVYTLFDRECYEVVFALFAFATIYIFLKAMHRQSADFSQSFFLFMTLGIYFQTYNTMRYYLALAIALYSMKYVLNRDWIKFIFIILLAALFHKSVLLVIPVYWLASLEWRNVHILMGFAFSVLCFAGRKLVLKLALILYPSYKNTIYLEGNISISSVLRIAAVLALYLWFARYMGEQFRNQDAYREFRFYGQLNLLAFATCTFFSFLPVITRIAYYFSISQILLIPMMLHTIKEEQVKRRAEALICLACIIYFGIFLLQAHQAGVGLLPYRSWLFETERHIYK